MVLKECSVTVAESGMGIIAFLARKQEDIHLLHTHPRYIGKGAGTLLIEAAQATTTALQLWCFQANVRARRFYEARGFRAVEFTNGEGNQEKMPDVRYCWTRP
jgi:putative acetyltransferase